MCEYCKQNKELTEALIRRIEKPLNELGRTQQVDSILKEIDKFKFLIRWL